MKLLLDTHIWIWSHVEPERLAPPVAAALEAPDNELWLSSNSVWEFLLLVERGRVRLETSPRAWLDEALVTRANPGGADHARGRVAQSHRQNGPSGSGRPLHCRHGRASRAHARHRRRVEIVAGS